MRYRLDAKGATTSIDSPLIKINPGSLLVQVHAFCLLSADSVKSGYSFAGTVLEAFEGSSWRIGSKVWGFTTSQDYSDQVSVPEWAVHKMKTNLTFAESATLAGPAVLSVHALQIGQVPASGHPRVLIHGGHTGIGSFAIQAARVMKCEVEVTTTLEYRERCRDLGCNGFVDLIEGTPHGNTIASFRARPERNFHLVIDTLADDASLYDYIEKFTHENAKYVTVKERSVSWGGFLKKMTTSVPRDYEYLTNPLISEKASNYLEIVSNMLNNHDFVGIEIQEEYNIEELSAAVRAAVDNRGFGCIVVHLVSPDSVEFQETLLAAQTKGLSPARQQDAKAVTSVTTTKSNEGRKRSLSLSKNPFSIE